MDKFLQQKLVSIEANQSAMSSKIDQISDAIIVLTRVEEKLINQHEDISELKDNQDQLFNRLRSVETTQAVTVNNMGIGGKFIAWLCGIAAAIIAAVAGYNLR